MGLSRVMAKYAYKQFQDGTQSYHEAYEAVQQLLYEAWMRGETAGLASFAPTVRSTTTTNTKSDEEEVDADGVVTLS